MDDTPWPSRISLECESGSGSENQCYTWDYQNKEKKKTHMVISVHHRYLRKFNTLSWASLMTQIDVKESACNAKDMGSIPWSGWSPGEGNGFPLQSFCLETPMDRGIWQVTVHRVSKSQTRLSNKHVHRMLFPKSDIYPISYIMIKLALFQGFKDDLVSTNQSM